MPVSSTRKQKVTIQNKIGSRKQMKTSVTIKKTMNERLKMRRQVHSAVTRKMVCRSIANLEMGMQSWDRRMNLTMKIRKQN